MKFVLAFLILIAGLYPSRISAEQSFAPSQATAPLKIGNQLQLFVDDYLIDSMNGADLVLHSPQPAGTAIRFDKPWEGNTSAYVTVFYDGSKFRMYYRGSSDPAYIRKAALKPGESIVAKHANVTCYAESRDGITWTKPSLGIVEFHGSRDNNIILRDDEASENFEAFFDSNPAAPKSERYKAVGGGGRGLFAFKSADGIHWQKMTEKRIITDADSQLTIPGSFDSLNVAFWDAHRHEYVAFYRDLLQGVRTIKYTTSKDFLHWTPGVWADYGNTPIEHLYTNAATPYFRAPQIYLAFPNRFIPWRHVFNDAPADGVSESVFMSSRDGVHWDRRFMEAFVRPGRDPLDWVHRTHMIAAGILTTAPDEISLFISRHYTYPSAFLERVTLRTDGFVSIHAGYHGGSFTTKPLVIEGDRLALNYATSAAGSIQWEILDVNGNPLPGFSVEQTKLLSGDEIERSIQLPKGIGARPIRLRFILKDADLYSLQILK